MKVFCSIAFLLLFSISQAIDDDCPFFCNCSLLNIVNCRSARIFTFPDKLPAGTKYFLMDYNNITTIPNGTLAKMAPNLIEFTMSYNGRSDKPFNIRTFEGLKFLKTLDLSGNKIFDFPLYIPLTVETLLIADNYVYLQLDLSNHTNLKTLDLSKNGFSQIDYNVFSKSIVLDTLFLRDNMITEISTGAFRNNKNLQSLYLDGNQLTSDVLTPGTFLGLDNLKEIHFDGNPLTTVPVLPSNLQFLYLQNTQITRLHPGAFAQFVNLRGLFLQSTPYLTLEPETFVGMTSLNVLSLENCSFSPDVLGPGTLYGLTKLEDLSLENSSISALEPGLFQYSANLNTVNARGMKLATLDQGIITETTNASLTLLTLEGNPFLCDCHLAWLKELSERKDKSPAVGDPSKLLCAGPEAVQQKSFAELTVKDFVCN